MIYKGWKEFDIYREKKNYNFYTEQPFSTNMVPFKSLFIDDLCVDKQARGQAKELGCYEVTLNVWTGNTSAEHFYEKMGMKTKERQMEYIL